MASASIEKIKEREEKIKKLAEELNTPEQGTLYFYLYHLGWNLEKARLEKDKEA